MLNCQEVSRCSSPALHTGKIKAKPLDFYSHTILITTSNQEYLIHFPWACSKASCILGIHAKKQLELLLRERCGFSPHPRAVNLDPFTEQSQHQERALLTLPPNIIAVLEEIKDAFGQAGKQKNFVFLLLSHK